MFLSNIRSQLFKNFKKSNVNIKLIALFIVCSSIYLINGKTISSGDSVPNTLLVLNLLENHTLNFDAFRESYFVERGVFYSFIQSPNGHLTSVYPIGTALITAPFYVLFYYFLKISNIPVNLTHESFEVYRLCFEKYAATIIAASSVVLFYSASKLKFNEVYALISTFIFAFATNTWVTSSQGLWQHGPSNLCLIIIIFCLIKANHVRIDNSKTLLLVIAGIFCGLLPSIRPTSTLFLIAALLYSVVNYRFRSIFLLLGMVSSVPGLLWNFYHFGNLVGGYSSIGTQTQLYAFTPQVFVEASLGTLISPSRGLFIFSPIILYSFVGAYKVFKLRSYPDEQLIGAFTLASLGLFLNYCFYIFWWAGYCYGPRFMTDIMPIACYLINYSLEELKLFKNRNFINLKYVLFSWILCISFFAQVVGVFGEQGQYWHVAPLKLENYLSRLWDVQDSLLERHTQALFHRVFPPPVEKAKYIKGLSGIIKEITYNGNHPIPSNLSIPPQSPVLLEAVVENTGSSRWYGYKAAVSKGEVRVRVLFLNSKREMISEQYLYVSGTPKRNQVTRAIGSIISPNQPGIYKIELDLVSVGVSIVPNNAKDSRKELEIQVSQ